MTMMEGFMWIFLFLFVVCVLVFVFLVACSLLVLLVVFLEMCLDWLQGSSRQSHLMFSFCPAPSLCRMCWLPHYGAIMSHLATPPRRETAALLWSSGRNVLLNSCSRSPTEFCMATTSALGVACCCFVAVVCFCRNAVKGA